MISMKKFSLTFGLFDINDLFKSSNGFFVASDSPLPTRIKSLGFSVSLIQNLNFSFLVILVTVLIGLLVYFIGVKLEVVKLQK